MTLKYKVNSVEGLDESIKALYVEKDGVYTLSVDISESEEFKKLKSSKDKILDEKKKEQQRREEQEEKEREKAIEIAEKEKKYEESLKLTREKHKEEMKKAERFKNKLMESKLSEPANSLANRLAGEYAELMVSFIKNRLSLEEIDDSFNLVVLDENGIKTDDTLSDLEKELKENPLFAPIIKGRKSSGGSSDPNRANGSGEHEYEKYFKPDTANMTKQMELLKRDPTAYERLSTKHKVNPQTRRYTIEQAKAGKF